MLKCASNSVLSNLGRSLSAVCNDIATNSHCIRFWSAVIDRQSFGGHKIEVLSQGILTVRVPHSRFAGGNRGMHPVSNSFYALFWTVFVFLEWAVDRASEYSKETTSAALVAHVRIEICEITGLMVSCGVTDTAGGILRASGLNTADRGVILILSASSGVTSISSSSISSTTLSSTSPSFSVFCSSLVPLPSSISRSPSVPPSFSVSRTCSVPFPFSVSRSLCVPSSLSKSRTSSVFFFSHLSFSLCPFFSPSLVLPLPFLRSLSLLRSVDSQVSVGPVVHWQSCLLEFLLLPPDLPLPPATSFYLRHSIAMAVRTIRHNWQFPVAAWGSRRFLALSINYPLKSFGISHYHLPLCRLLLIFLLRWCF